MRFSYKPEISVILPTFNRANVLCEALQSVLDQTFREWELIIVDDGSSDNTFETLDPFIQKHMNIRYMKHNNRGAAMSRNAGISASLGRYITFLDSDDLYLPSHLESRHGMLETMPEVALLSGGYSCDVDTWVRDRHNPEKLVHISECIVGATMFGRRDLFFKLEGFRELDYAEDTDFWERAGIDHTILKIETPQTYRYRQSHDSITKHYKPAKP